MKSKIKFGGTFGNTEPTTTVKIKKIAYGSDIKNIEKDAAQELTELQIEFKAAAKKENQLKEDNTTTEFYSTFIFKTPAQRDEFCRLLNLKSEDIRYIDGQKLIKALELKIDQVNIKEPGKFKCNLEIATLAMK